MVNNAVIKQEYEYHTGRTAGQESGLTEKKNGATPHQQGQGGKDFGGSSGGESRGGGGGGRKSGRRVGGVLYGEQRAGVERGACLTGSDGHGSAQRRRGSCLRACGGLPAPTLRFCHRLPPAPDSRACHWYLFVADLVDPLRLETLSAEKVNHFSVIADAELTGTVTRYEGFSRWRLGLIYRPSAWEEKRVVTGIGIGVVCVLFYCPVLCCPSRRGREAHAEQGGISAWQPSRPQLFRSPVCKLENGSGVEIREFGVHPSVVLFSAVVAVAWVSARQTQRRARTGKRQQGKTTNGEKWRAIIGICIHRNVSPLLSSIHPWKEGPHDAAGVGSAATEV
ncbi:hypothetical protein DFH27DRAFT_617099 [Peziza echinospora]|nr:hypothetical protein DFH27DRAFT_617099 [Peziza echinospora]